MTEKSAKRASEILEELATLRKYKKLIDNKSHGDVAHFEFVQHYGNCNEHDKVVISHRYTQKMLEPLKDILIELETELNNLT